MFTQLLTGAVFALGVSVLSYRLRFLTRNGSVAQFALGTVILGLGGWKWTVPMVVFFLCSSLLSRWKASRKEELTTLFAKTSTRDAAQVFANGGVACLMVALWLFGRDEGLFVAYLGAVAAATADTWGTEVGVLSRKPPRLFTSFRKVGTGTSGAISAIGIAAGIAGSVTIVLSALPWLGDLTPTGLLLAVVSGGLAGALTDSFLGATLQVRYTCQGCGRTTERTVHCGSTTRQTGGIRWFGNDLVNFLCTGTGALVAFAAHLFLAR